MSVYAYTYIWETSKQKGTALLMMLALAEYANHETGECYPSIPTLSKLLRMSERNAQLLLRKLADNKDIEIIDHDGLSTGTGNTNRYVIRGYAAWRQAVKEISSHDDEAVKRSSPHKNKGVKSSASRGEKSGKQEVKPASPKPSVLEPLKEPSGNTKDNAPGGAQSPSKPPKRLNLPEKLKDWTWRHIEQYACDEPQIETLAAFEEKSLLKNLPTAHVARDAIELFQELRRLKVPPDRWQSLFVAGQKVKSDASIFKRMLWAIPNWLKTEQAFKPAAPVIQSDGTPEPAHPAVIYGTDGKPMTWEEFQNGKLQKLA